MSRKTKIDLDQLMTVATRFEEARTADPGLEGAELGDLIRMIPGNRALFYGTYRGKDAVFRMSLSDDPGEVFENEFTELTRLWAYMHDGPYRVAEPLHFCASHHIVVIARVPGQDFMPFVKSLPEAKQSQTLAQAASWLARYTEPTQDWRPAKPDGWIKRAAKAAKSQPFSELRDMELAILDAMIRIGDVLSSQTWRTARSHGDFHANNLIAKDSILTGIDTGGIGRLPIYKDIARFLTHSARRNLMPSGTRRFGVDQDLLTAFENAFVMTDEERRLHMPFFLGFEALIRVESHALRPYRIKLAHRMARNMLDDLDRL